MRGSTGLIQQSQSTIGFDELTSMVTELMSCFQELCCEVSGEESLSLLDSGWISPNLETRVVRYGSSASVLYSVLNQTTDAVSAEYEILHQGQKVFSWSDYVWPNMKNGHSRQAGEVVTLPQACLADLAEFHIEHETAWLRRYRKTQSDPARIDLIHENLTELGESACYPRSMKFA